MRVIVFERVWGHSWLGKMVDNLVMSLDIRLERWLWEGRKMILIVNGDAFMVACSKSYD